MSVNRKNFVPAPKVDSAVISIQPRENQADINLDEWDGLIKLCFARPNRTLHATFRKKKVLALLDENRNAFLASHGAVPSESIGEFVERVVEEMMESRPMQLDIEDFMGLLQRFNEGGVHFQ
jgi:18S rRNA (adenine1779-N6/adenine1780-N6)-dimethyltransferase